MQQPAEPRTISLVYCNPIERLVAETSSGLISVPRCVFTICTKMPMASRISATSRSTRSRRRPQARCRNGLPATGIVFRETTADYENSWHRAPRRQYVISLAGGISITASDGETRHIGTGEIVLVEDTTGKGQITRS